MTTKNEELVQQFLKLWATRDKEGMAAMFAVDGVYDNVPDAKPMHGREAIETWLGFVFDHLTRIDVEVLHIASKDDWVLTERLDVHVHGDHKMPLPVMGACQVRDGKLVMWRDYYDMKTVESLGLVE